MASEEDSKMTDCIPEDFITSDNRSLRQTLTAAIARMDAQTLSRDQILASSHDATVVSPSPWMNAVVQEGYHPIGTVSANSGGIIPLATSLGVAERILARPQTATEMPQHFQNPTFTVKRGKGDGDFVTPFGNRSIPSTPVKSSSTPEKEWVYFSAAHDFVSNKTSVPSLFSPMSTALATKMRPLQTPSRTFDGSPCVRTSMNGARDSPGHRRTAPSHMRTAADGSSGGRTMAQQGLPNGFADLPTSFQEAMRLSSYDRMASGNAIWPPSPAENQQPTWTPLSEGYGYNASATSMVPRSYTTSVDNSGMMTTAGYTGKPYSIFSPQRLNDDGTRPRDVPVITPHTHTAYRGSASPGAPSHAPVGLHRTATSDQMHPFYTPRLQPPGCDIVAQHTTQYAPQAGLGVAPDALAGPAMLPQSPHKAMQTVTPAGSPAPSNARTPRSNPNMPGQKPGFPQDIKQHHRRCNPFSKTCAVSCEYEKNHPEKWKMHGKKLYRLRAPASWQEKLPDGSSTTRRVPAGQIVSGLWLAFWGLDASQTTKLTTSEVQRHELDWRAHAR